MRRPTLSFVLLGMLAALLILLGMLALMRPSNVRDWQRDQLILSHSEREGNFIHVYNVRNFTYRATDDFDPHYYNATYDLRNVTSVEWIIEPFSSWQGISHTFVTFGFSDGRRLAISVEQRREVGEEFGYFNGVLNQFELMYVVGDEQDLIKLRTNYRNDTMRMYPLNLTPAQSRALLLTMLGRANKLRDEPEFYHGITSTCTTNVIDDLNGFLPQKIPWRFGVIFPGYSDKLLHKRGLLNISLPISEARVYYRIDERGRACGDCPDYSAKIREWPNLSARESLDG